MAEKIKSSPKHLFAGWPMIIAWIAMLIFAFHASTHMVGAGDTWVAMACGRHFINHGISNDTITVEPFSANSHKAGPTAEEIAKWPEWAQWITDKVGIDTVKYWHPTGWVNQNWLTHVTFYWLTHLSPVADAESYSFNSLVYWKIALYIISVICVYYTGRLLGANPALSAVFACFAMFVGRSYFDIRPAGFSNMLSAVLLLVFAVTTYRNIWYIWLIVPLAVFWCNVHGGYIYLFMMLVSFTALNFLTIISKKRFVSIGLKGIYHTAAAGIVAFLAIIIFNPLHLTNITHTFIISLSKHAEMWRTVNEWHPAFEWSNPVGTGYPFLIMYAMGIGLVIYWALSFLLKPRFLQAPASELSRQQNTLKIILRAMGFTATIFLFWLTLLSFSFINNDSESVFICIIFAVILLLSVYKDVHFIYLILPLTMIALNGAKARVDFEGRYIYPFAILPSYVILHSIAASLSEKIKFKARNILFVTAAAVASIALLLVFFNPLKVPESGFTFASVFQLKSIYHPRFTKNARPTYQYLLLALYIVNLVSIAAWFAISYLKKVFISSTRKIDEAIKKSTYELPKIDLAMIAIAALSIYMAIRSRRFIPIAAIAACPIIAIFIEQLVRVVSAVRNFNRENLFYVTPMSRCLKIFFITLGVAVVVTFSMRWGLKFKRIYLDPSPNDPQLNSVFMRMTASNAKPFYACQFIKMNKLKGKMFNYWTEGGFIAYGQEPDPNTGETPLKLFMDGRAQAAYEPEKYNLWMEIMGGGPIAQNARLRKQKLKKHDYVALGRWINNKLKRYNVWVVMMPAGQFYKPFMLGIIQSPDWRMVFLNNKQKIMVDITTEEGEKLFKGIFDGTTKYPDELTRELVVAHYMFIRKDESFWHTGLNMAIEAFNQNQSPMFMREILIAASRHQVLKSAVYDFCREYAKRFEENKALWANEDGYRYRIIAALMAAENLISEARFQKHSDLVEFYANKKKRYESELRELRKITW